MLVCLTDAVVHIFQHNIFSLLVTVSVAGSLHFVRSWGALSVQSLVAFYHRPTLKQRSPKDGQQLAERGSAASDLPKFCIKFHPSRFRRENATSFLNHLAIHTPPPPLWRQSASGIAYEFSGTDALSIERWAHFISISREIGSQWGTARQLSSFRSIDIPNSDRRLRNSGSNMFFRSGAHYWLTLVAPNRVKCLMSLYSKTRQNNFGIVL